MENKFDRCLKNLLTVSGVERGELALTGSILQRYPRIRQGVAERCLARYPHMEIIDPRGSAAWGAARLALAMKEE